MQPPRRLHAAAASWRCARASPLGVLCGTASLKRAPAGSGRSRDRLKLRPQLLGGVRMAGLERLLARCPRPDAAAISPPWSFAAFAERRRWVGPNHAKFLCTRTPARAEPKVLRGAARRPPRRFARYASLTAGAGAWRRRCAITCGPSAELGIRPPQAAWRGAVVHPSGGPSAPGRRCWRLGRKRPSPFSNSGPTPLRSDPNLEGLKV